MGGFAAYRGISSDACVVPHKSLLPHAERDGALNRCLLGQEICSPQKTSDSIRQVRGLVGQLSYTNSIFLPASLLFRSVGRKLPCGRALVAGGKPDTEFVHFMICSLSKNNIRVTEDFGGKPNTEMINANKIFVRNSEGKKLLGRLKLR